LVEHENGELQIIHWAENQENYLSVDRNSKESIIVIE